MPLVGSGLTAATANLDSADKHARGQVAWLNAHPLELLGCSRFETAVNVNTFANRSGATAVLKTFGVAQNLLSLGLTNTKCSHW